MYNNLSGMCCALYRGMTINQTLKAIKALGLTARYNPEYQEYRINIPNGKEATAYYTNDSEDAIKTAESSAELMKVLRNRA